MAAQRWRRRRDRDPDVIDDTGPFTSRRAAPLARRDTLEPVVVAPRFVVAADALALDALLEARELERRRAGTLGMDGGGKRESHEGSDGDGQGRVSHVTSCFFETCPHAECRRNSPSVRGDAPVS